MAISAVTDTQSVGLIGRYGVVIGHLAELVYRARLEPGESARGRNGLGRLRGAGHGRGNTPGCIPDGAVMGGNSNGDDVLRGKV
jgi:hypothetical protein